MTPELSRLAAEIKRRLGLQIDDPRLRELIEATERGWTVADLPAWAREAVKP